MSGFELVAGVIGIFFGAGVAVGVLLVVALPLFTRRRGGGRYMDGGGWQEPTARRDDDDTLPRWPGL